MILSDECIRRPVFATMLVGSLLVVGMVCFGRLGLDLFPRVDIPTVTVTTTLAGAGPEEIETRITKPIEDAVSTISGIDEIRSESIEGMSRVVAIFELERSLDAAAQDVRDKVARVVFQLPEGTDPPVVEKFDVDATPVMYLTVTGGQDLKQLTELAKKRVKEVIEGISGVGAISVLGGRAREIQVELEAAKLQAYRLTVPEVARALALANIEIPGGRLIRGSREAAVRTQGRLQRVADFLDVQVANRDGQPVRVRDIGNVVDGTVEPRSLSRYNTRNAVTLAVRKQSGSNVVAVVDAIRKRLPGIRASLPPGTSVEVTRDWSVFIREANREVEQHMLLGALLASAVVLLFLNNVRATVIAAVAIPTAIVATFAAVYLAGFTLNRVTLLALALAVGIVIDDAIVVLENAWRFVEEKDLDPVTAAREGTADVGLAVSATTLSLVAVFVPVAFVKGVTGQFLRSFGLTMAFAILVSLLVAFTLTPALCARLLRKRSGTLSRASRFYAPIDRAYGALVRWALAHRWTVVALAAALVAAVPPLVRWTGGAFMPEDDRGEFEVNLRLPQGTSLTRADAVLREMEAELRPLPGVRGLLTAVGGVTGDDVTAAQIFVVLDEDRTRRPHQHRIMQWAREKMRAFRSRVRVSVDNPPPVQGSGYGAAEIQITVRGPEPSRLEEAARQLRAILERTPGAVDVDTSALGGKPEVQLTVLRDRASDLGVQVADVATTVRALLAGEVVTRYKEGGDLYDVRLRLREADRQQAEQLAALPVPSAKLGQVRLDSVVDLRAGTGPAKIDRKNRQRQVTVSANVAPGHALGDVLASALAQAGNLGLPPSYLLDVGGRGKLYGETVEGFRLALGLSVVFMYMVLAAQFESFLHPVTILLSLPLAVPFALVSLWATGNTINLFSGLGILLLFGIVKKNSILQVDHTLALRRAGVPRTDAIVRANRDRLRPILMTTFSLVAAMIPAAVARGAGAEVSRSIAIVVVGGQSLCLLITLLITPVAYSLFDDLGAQAADWMARRRALPAPSAAAELRPEG